MLQLFQIFFSAIGLFIMIFFFAQQPLTVCSFCYYTLFSDSESLLLFHSAFAVSPFKQNKNTTKKKTLLFSPYLNSQLRNLKNGNFILFFFYYFNLYLFNLQSIHPSITHLGGILILKESEKTQNPSTQAFARHCDPAEKVLEVGHGETLSTNVSTLEARLGKPIRSACLCEKTPLCLSSGGGCGGE